MLAEETFWMLFNSLAHWEFEIFLMLLFDVIIGWGLWGFIKRHIHKDDKSLEDRIQEEIRVALEHMHEDTGVNHDVD